MFESLQTSFNDRKASLEILPYKTEEVEFIESSKIIKPREACMRSSRCLQQFDGFNLQKNRIILTGPGLLYLDNAIGVFLYNHTAETAIITINKFIHFISQGDDSKIDIYESHIACTCYRGKFWISLKIYSNPVMALYEMGAGHDCIMFDGKDLFCTREGNLAYNNFISIITEEHNPFMRPVEDILAEALSLGFNVYASWIDIRPGYFVDRYIYEISELPQKFETYNCVFLPHLRLCLNEDNAVIKMITNICTFIVRNPCIRLHIDNYDTVAIPAQIWKTGQLVAFTKQDAMEAMSYLPTMKEVLDYDAFIIYMNQLMTVSNASPIADKLKQVSTIRDLMEKSITILIHPRIIVM